MPGKYHSLPNYGEIYLTILYFYELEFIDAPHGMGRTALAACTS